MYSGTEFKSFRTDLNDLSKLRDKMTSVAEQYAHQAFGGFIRNQKLVYHDMWEPSKRIDPYIQIVNFSFHVSTNPKTIDSYE